MAPHTSAVSFVILHVKPGAGLPALSTTTQPGTTGGVYDQVTGRLQPLTVAATVVLVVGV